MARRHRDVRPLRTNPVRVFGESLTDLLWEFGGAAAAVIASDHLVFPTIAGVAQRMAPQLFASNLAVKELNAASTAATGAGLGIAADHLAGEREGNLVKRGGVGIGVLRAAVGLVQGGGVSVDFPPANAFRNPFAPALPAAQAAGAAAQAAGAASQAAGAAAMAASASGPAAVASSNDLGI